MQLDVLVLATTYISHLSQLLHEDDLRATHDTNNNTTASVAAVGVKVAGMEQHAHCQKGESTTRGSQKGLLHPVKVRRSERLRLDTFHVVQTAFCRSVPQ